MDYICKKGASILKNIKISDSEWMVIKLIWERPGLTSTDIIQNLSPQTTWKPKTIHSLINRLVQKGAVGIDKNDSHFRFYPLVKKEDCIMEESKSFIKRVYDGSIDLMVANFIKNGEISENEIEDLRKLLDENDKK